MKTLLRGILKVPSDGGIVVMELLSYKLVDAQMVGT